MKDFSEFLVKFLDVFKGGGFGFVSEREFGEMGKWRQKGFLTFGKEMIVEKLVILCDGGLDNRVFWLIGLNKNRGVIEVSSSNTANDLG